MQHRYRAKANNPAATDYATFVAAKARFTTVDAAFAKEKEISPVT